MKTYIKKPYVYLGLATVILLAGFQNCSGARFTKQAQLSSESLVSTQLVPVNNFSEILSESQPHHSENGINWVYGGSCPLGFSIRATLMISKSRDCIPEQEVRILPCVDDGSGVGQWSYESLYSGEENAIKNTSINFIFDVYNPDSQLSNESFEPIGGVWNSGSSNPNLQVD